ncbi:MAG: hypothetical protein AAF171_25235 [Cyanobacteria bacterium P01_A01_bin.116]
MTIQLLDQALNNAIALLIYGSEFWLAVSFSLYLARRIAKASKKSSNTHPHPTKQPTTQPTEPSPNSPPLKPSGISVSITYAAADSQPQPALPIADKSSTQTASEQTNSEQTAPEQNTDLKAPAVPVNPSKALTSKTIRPKVTNPKISKPRTEIPKTLTPPKTINNNISCEPVNWKQWKVGDLRKASLYKACGVRIRPIGSRRNLPKADLIAQYEQNLKRLTRLPSSAVVEQSKSA